MDTAVTNSNHHIAIAIGSDAARTLTLAFALGISLDIVTKRASAARITAPSICESGWYL
jgi:hypothetical protein